MKTTLVLALLVVGLALPLTPGAAADCLGGPLACHVVDCPSDPNVDRPCHLRAVETAERVVGPLLP